MIIFNNKIKTIAFLLLSTISFSLLAKPSLKMLVWDGYAPSANIESFKDMINKKYETEIDVKVDLISDPDDFFKATRSGKYHLISPTHNLLKDQRYDFIKNKLLAPIDTSIVTNYDSLLPYLKEHDFNKKDGEIFSIPFIYGPYGLAYKISSFTEEPTSWKVLWDENYKKKYTLSSDYSEVNVYIAALASGLSATEMYNVNKLHEKSISNKLESLHSGAHHFWEGVDTAKDYESVDLAVVWGFALPEINKNGEVWKFAKPQEGTPGWVDNYAVVQESIKNDDLMRKISMEWLNYVISAEFQKNVVIDMLGSFPTSLSAKKLLDDDSIKKNNLDNPNYFEKNYIMWPTLDRRERNNIINLWNNAKSK